MLCDDLGYGDLGCYGNETISTPNLDALADSGLRNKDLLRSRIMLPAMLRNQGYSTSLLGKWHLGMEEGLHPLDQGFDYFYGTEGSNDPITVDGREQVYETFKTARSEEDWPVHLYQDRRSIEFPARQSLFTQRYTREAQRIIGECNGSNTPFFIYLAHNMPHVPLFASEAFFGKSRGGLYGDVVEELDWSVGEIVKTLEREGLRENTLLLFTSDNGPWTMFKEFGGTARPLRGEKGTGWEGGPRVPAVFSWPGTIGPGVTDAFMVNIDLYATIATLTGSSLPSGYEIDSIDMSKVLTAGEESPRRSYLFLEKQSAGRRKATFELFAYRSGDHKIHLRTKECARDPDTADNVPVTMHDPPLLYNLTDDVSEAADISADHREIVENLLAEMEYDKDELF